MEKKNEKLMQARIKEYLAAGVAPLEWRLYPVLKISDGSSLGYFSKLFVNSLKLGAIAPETYEPCTVSTLRGAKLAMWQLEETDRLFSALLAKGRTLPMITISMPLKMFLGKTAKRAFSDFLKTLSPQKANKICLAFTPEILFMKTEEVNPKLEETAETGIKTALTGYGEEYCPPLRLKGLKFDYVYFAPEFSLALERGETDVKALAGMAKELGFTCIGQLFHSEKYLPPEKMPSLEEGYLADYVTGGAGNTVKELFGNIFGEEKA